MINLEETRVLVTGGTRGIGLGIASVLAAAGAQVIAGYRSDDAAAESALLSLQKLGREDHRIVKADVTTYEGVSRLVSACEGSLNGLVTSAGTISHIAVRDLGIDEWERVVNTNLTASFRLTQAALPIMPKGSSIVYVGSKVANVGVPLRAHYTAAKAGLIGFMRTVSKEEGHRGVRVNVVAPGVIESEATAGLTADARARYEQMTAVRRLGNPEEVGHVASFLISPLSSYVTGQVIQVDGGI